VAEEAGDVARAFRSYTVALALDPSLAFARRHLEQLRLAPRPTYQYRWPARVERAVREVHLDPTPTGLARLVAAAQQAHSPEIAVRVHLATGIDPGEDGARLALAEEYAAVGLPAAGAALLPAAPGSGEAAARAQAVALAAGRADLAGAAAAALRRTSMPVAPALRLVDIWARSRRSGVVELALALEKLAESPPDHLDVAGRPSPFERPPATWSVGEVYVHRVPLTLGPGKHSIRIGTGSAIVEVEPFVHDFEAGTALGWEAAGDAFAGAPRAPSRTGRRVLGFQGNRFLDSYRNGDQPQGTLRSPVLDLTVEEVCFLVGGGRSNRTGVGLEVGGGVRVNAAGRDDEILREACLDARPFAGEQVRIIVYDREGGAWGHVLADDFECLQAGRPVPCAGRVTASVADSAAARP
jgi:hypothetical protein